MKSGKQINEELAALEALKGQLRSSMFGDDNNAALAAQISILAGDVTEDDVDEKEESGEWDEHICGNARDALVWLSGEYDGDLASEWAILKKS